MRGIGRHLKPGAVALATAAVIGGAFADGARGDPIGDQVRVSAQGPGTGTGNAAFDALDPALAYDSRRNQYLAVWRGDTTTVGENEVWARLIDAGGMPLGLPMRVSNMGPPDNKDYDALEPKVAYNSASDEYLVVWQGDHDVVTIDNEFEIWGRRLAGDGTPASAQFRISQMGDDGDVKYIGRSPDVVYNQDLNQYVIVWEGDQPTPGNDDNEIWARRLSAGGPSIDTDEVRVSDIGPPGFFHTARAAEITYDSDGKTYLVVFAGDELVSGKFEIHGQILGQGLGQVGTNDFPISSTPAGRDAISPEVAYNPIAKRSMAVWSAEKGTLNAFEVYAQLMDGTGVQLGPDDLRVSVTGPDADPEYQAFAPMVVAHDRASEFLVSWQADDDQPGLVVNENEIFAQRYAGDGTLMGAPETRVSTMGPDGDPGYDARGSLAGAFNSQAGEYLLAWEGDDNAGGLVAGEFEVYVRRDGAAAATAASPARCAPVPARGTPAQVRVPTTISAPFLKTNQRTGAAAVRRANAIDNWLGDGVVDRDLCGGGLAPADLDSRLTATSGMLGPNPPEADPRPVTVSASSGGNATFRANAIQMCINQRIYQAGISRANALAARLAGKLTGGDLTDATLTRGRLRQDLTITGATANPNPPAASTTDLTPPNRQGCGAVRFTPGQAAINRRIAIASVVRINGVLDQIAGGLTGENFADGSITKVDFGPGVTP